MKPLAILLAFAGASGAIVGPVHAASGAFADRVVMTATVSTDDLDLQTGEGQRQLEQRVNVAVRQVCRVVDANTGLAKMNRDARACVAKARAGAFRQMAALIEGERRGG